MDKVEVPRSSAPGPVDLEVLPRLESYRGHNRKDEETEFGSTITYDPVVQRSLLRKCDWFILPPLTFMYLCNALDKGNVANAKTDGWDKDIGLTGDQVRSQE
ncbi:hypothetical protein HHX47_DHR1001511 [Lentinula edodes]|nr:hypothetical protein HHX47_DHR1001511 [Lentinula edodes]